MSTQCTPLNVLATLSAATPYLCDIPIQFIEDVDDDDVGVDDAVPALLLARDRAKTRAEAKAKANARLSKFKEKDLRGALFAVRKANNVLRQRRRALLHDFRDLKVEVW